MWKLKMRKQVKCETFKVYLCPAGAWCYCLNPVSLRHAAVNSSGLGAMWHEAIWLAVWLWKVAIIMFGLHCADLLPTLITWVPVRYLGWVVKSWQKLPGAPGCRWSSGGYWPCAKCRGAQDGRIPLNNPWGPLKTPKENCNLAQIAQSKTIVLTEERINVMFKMGIMDFLHLNFFFCLILSTDRWMPTPLRNIPEYIARWLMTICDGHETVHIRIEISGEEGCEQADD